MRRARKRASERTRKPTERASERASAACGSVGRSLGRPVGQARRLCSRARESERERASERESERERERASERAAGTRPHAWERERARGRSVGRLGFGFGYRFGLRFGFRFGFGARARRECAHATRSLCAGASVRVRLRTYRADRLVSAPTRRCHGARKGIRARVIGCGTHTFRERFAMHTVRISGTRPNDTRRCGRAACRTALVIGDLNVASSRAPSLVEDEWELRSTRLRNQRLLATPNTAPIGV